MRVGCALVAGLFLAIPSSTAGAAPEYMGASRCANCHESEYKQWQTTGHANALSRLTPVQQRDATCRTCHTMDPSSDDPSLMGVQCESCHGAGTFYSPRHVMKDEKLAALLGLKEIDATRCTSCHLDDAPSVMGFRFEERVALVRHKPLSANAMPPKEVSSSPKKAPRKKGGDR